MKDINKGRISGDPFKDSPYFEYAEKDMERHWKYYIEPRIQKFDKSMVLDLACGHGRNTALLAPISEKVIAADINEECVGYCRERFSGAKNVECHLLDGVSLSDILSNSLTLIYSWDSMVHFEPDVIASYVKDISRALAPGGHSFIHHSNNCHNNVKDFKNEPHWRNYMSKEIFKTLINENGLKIISQDIIGWDESLIKKDDLENSDLSGYVPDLDCISVFYKPEK